MYKMLNYIYVMITRRVKLYERYEHIQHNY